MPLEIHDVGEYEAPGLLAVYRDKNRWGNGWIAWPWNRCAIPLESLPLLREELYLRRVIWLGLGLQKLCRGWMRWALLFPEIRIDSTEFAKNSPIRSRPP